MHPLAYVHFHSSANDGVLVPTEIESAVTAPNAAKPINENFFMCPSVGAGLFLAAILGVVAPRL
jgi:hypothetical protein